MVWPPSKSPETSSSSYHSVQLQFPHLPTTPRWPRSGPGFLMHPQSHLSDRTLTGTTQAITRAPRSTPRYLSRIFATHRVFVSTPHSCIYALTPLTSRLITPSRELQPWSPWTSYRVRTGMESLFVCGGSDSRQIRVIRLHVKSWLSPRVQRFSLNMVPMTLTPNPALMAPTTSSSKSWRSPTPNPAMILIAPSAARSITSMSPTPNQPPTGCGSKSLLSNTGRRGKMNPLFRPRNFGQTKQSPLKLIPPTSRGTRRVFCTSPILDMSKGRLV